MAGDTFTTIDKHCNASIQNGSLNPSFMIFNTSLMIPGAPRNVLEIDKNNFHKAIYATCLSAGTRIKLNKCLITYDK